MSGFQASRTQVVAWAALLAVAATILALAVAVSASPGDPTGSHGLPQEEPTGTATTPPADVDDVDFSVSTYEVFLARDPFEPVVPEPVSADGDGEDGADTDGDGTDGDGDGTDGDGDGTNGDPTTAPTTAPTTGGDPTGSPSPGDDSCRQEATTVCDGHTVRLIDVFDSDSGGHTAAVQVDNTVYEVGVDDTFASNFRVRSIEPPCATLMFGDDAFTLCEGESVLK